MKISYSSYSSFKECPLRFRYQQRVNEIKRSRGYNPWEDRPSYMDAEIGNRMHRILWESINGLQELAAPEEIWKELKKDKELMMGWKLKSDVESLEEYAVYEASLKNKGIIWHDEDEYVKKIEALLRGIEKVVDSYSFEGYHRERNREFKEDGIKVGGRIDLWKMGEIVEIKTGKDFDLEQLKFYSLIEREKIGYPPVVHLVLLLQGEVITYHWGDEELDALKEDVLSTARLMMEGFSEPRKGEHCRYCPFRKICEKGSF